MNCLLTLFLSHVASKACSIDCARILMKINIIPPRQINDAIAVPTGPLCRRTTVHRSVRYRKRGEA
jgi:hypothetical protein